MDLWVAGFFFFLFFLMFKVEVLDNRYILIEYVIKGERKCNIPGRHSTGLPCQEIQEVQRELKFSLDKTCLF